MEGKGLYGELHNQIRLRVALSKEGDYAFTHKRMSRACNLFSLRQSNKKVLEAYLLQCSKDSPLWLQGDSDNPHLQEKASKYAPRIFTTHIAKLYIHFHKNSRQEQEQFSIPIASNNITNEEEALIYRSRAQQLHNKIALDL
jgi:hypothetical protein